MARSNDQRGEALRDGRVPQLPGAGALDLRAPDALADGAILDLAALLRRLLIGVEAHTGKSWAQRLLEGWIVDALDGDPKAMDGILTRGEVDRPAAAKADESPAPVDDRTARKILEVLCGSGPDAASG